MDIQTYIQKKAYWMGVVSNMTKEELSRQIIKECFRRLDMLGIHSFSEAYSIWLKTKDERLGIIIEMGIQAYYMRSGNTE